MKALTRYLALLCTFITLTVVGGVWATWKYYELPPQAVDTDIPVYMNDFNYGPINPDPAPDMPEGEVSLLERISDILNNEYCNDIIPQGDSCGYLLSTMDKSWSAGYDPAYGSFVGSMDTSTESKTRIDALFGDVIDFDDPNHVSFILKSENLIGGDHNEIALYSTSDPLDWIPDHYRVVGVYLSVFTPIVEVDVATGVETIIGYEQLCDSIHGYCLEVQYTETDYTPSFSTDHWRDELYYWNSNYADPQPITGEDRYKYECYHTADGNYAYPGRIYSWEGWINVQTNQHAIGDYMGRKAWQVLADILASQT